MPWSANHYPRSMNNLPEQVRHKAIEIANALLEQGMEEGMAIRIAIAKAKEWARHHGRACSVSFWRARSSEQGCSARRGAPLKVAT